MGTLAELLLAEVKGQAETEWVGKLGGEDVTISSRPLTSSDMSRISRAHPDFVRSPNMEGMVDLIILKCQDKNGEKAFDKGDKPILMRVGTVKIGEIFNGLFGAQLTEDDDEKFEDRVKN